jgi:hypothetical protein
MGHKPDEIVAALVAKQAKNEARVWPDWRKSDPDKAIEHTKIRSCNRHDDCEAANAKWLSSHPGRNRWEIPVNMHCHDEDCEDCFGQ